MSWISTRTYYECINRRVQRQTALMASAPLLIDSLDFRPLCGLTTDEEWDRAATILTESARNLERGGATAIVIAANTMHRIYDRVQDAVDIPIIHIAESVGKRMKEQGIASAALLGTRTVMTESFYRQRLVSYDVDLLAPDMNTVEMLDSIIYKELMLGKITRDAERALKTVITRKEQDGAEAIVLACAELELVVDVDANVLPIFDSAQIHCDAAVDWILGEGN